MKTETNTRLAIASEQLTEIFRNSQMNIEKACKLALQRADKLIEIANNKEPLNNILEMKLDEFINKVPMTVRLKNILENSFSINTKVNEIDKLDLYKCRNAGLKIINEFCEITNQDFNKFMSI